MKRKNIAMLLFLLVLFFASTVEATVVDPNGILTEENRQKVDQLELQSRKTVVIAVIPFSPQPMDDGTSILQEHEADVVILYRYEENKLAILQPSEKWLQDKDVHNVVTEFQDKKEQATSDIQRNIYLGNVIDGLSPALIRAKDTRSYCTGVKDGYCDPKCEGLDLDCQCGDAICQYHEVKITCSHDCGEVRDKFCTVLRDGICDENCAKDIDCGFGRLVTAAQTIHEEKNIEYKSILAILMVMLIAVSTIFGYLLHQQQKVKRK